MYWPVSLGPGGSWLSPPPRGARERFPSPRQSLALLVLLSHSSRSPSIPYWSYWDLGRGRLQGYAPSPFPHHQHWVPQALPTTGLIPSWYFQALMAQQAAKFPFCSLFLQQYPRCAGSGSATNCFPLESTGTNGLRGLGSTVGRKSAFPGAGQSLPAPRAAAV